MSTHRSRRSTLLGMLCLASALGLALFAYSLPFVWSAVIDAIRPSPALSYPLRSFWIPLSTIVLEGATALLGITGFLLLWRGRWDLGEAYAAKVGLALLAFLIAAMAYGAYYASGLTDYVAALAVLVPARAFLSIVGGVFLGVGLYWVLANLPLPGTRHLAAAALAIGFAGIGILGFAALEVRRSRAVALEGPGIALSVVSLILWMVLCLWSEQTLRNHPSVATPTAVSHSA